MKNCIFFLLVGISGPSLVSGQQLVCTRVAELQDGPSYTLDGRALLELFDDNTMTLRLSSDFSTPSGPDVQIYLANNPTSIAGGVMIANIGTTNGVNHFSGAATFNVPSGVDIDDFSHVVFHCVAFNQHWGQGALAEKECSGSGGNCPNTTISTVNDITEFSICHQDGESDQITFFNSEQIRAGTDYIYIITNETNQIDTVYRTAIIEFEGTKDGDVRVFGASVDGEISYQPGQDISSISSTGCIQLSDLNNFILIRKDACITAFDCESPGAISSGNRTEFNICPSDGESNVIALTNAGRLSAGDNFVYILTDEANRLQEVIMSNQYDFEGSPRQVQRVHGASYDGNLIFNTGQPLASLSATNCIEFSDTTQFLTIFKDGCAAEMGCLASSISFDQGGSLRTICPSDGEPDVIHFTNSLGEDAGDTYAYVFTNPQREIQFIHYANEYNFEGDFIDTSLIFGVSYVGDLLFTVGDPIQILASTDCALVSSSFVEVRKTGCNPDTACVQSIVATTDWVDEVVICPNDGRPDFIPLLNNIGIAPGATYAFLITDTNELIQEVHFQESFNFEGSGFETQRVYGISFEGLLRFNIGRHISTVSATECFQLSNTNTFLTIRKDACPNNTGQGFIVGQVRTLNNDAVENAQVILNDRDTVTTGQDGKFVFNQLVIGQTYQVSVYKNDDHKNGLTALDIVELQRHVLRIKTLPSPYLVVAGDLNHDDNLSALDIVELRRILLGLTDTFPNNTSWRFAPDNLVFTDSIRPFPIEEHYTFESLPANTDSVIFIGMKTGDLNLTAKPNTSELRQAEIRSQPLDVIFSSSQENVNPLDIINIDLSINDVSNIMAWQFELEHEGLELLNIESNVIPIDYRQYITDEFSTRFVWHHKQPIDFSSDQPILTLSFKALRNGIVADLLRFQDERLEPLFSTQDRQERSLILRHQASAVPTHLEMRIAPNPNNGLGVLSWNMPHAGKVQMAIYTIQGQQIWTQQAYFSAGPQQLDFMASPQWPDGLYFYELSGEEIGVQRVKWLIQR